MKFIIIFLALIYSLFAYVGDKSCKECHQDQTSLWKESLLIF